MSVDASPLLAHESPAAIVAYYRGVAVDARLFLAHASHLATCLPAATHVLNLCSDRYRFTVGLAACLLTGRVSLLPSTHTPEVIRQLTTFAPDTFCLTDDPACNIDLPRAQFPHLPQGGAVAWQIPQIAIGQLAAIVFTSGSTGTPLPYRKTWGKLARSIREGALRLGLLDGRRHTLIGTVPAQHMYGFESTVLLALLSGNALSAERPFYPVDVCAAIAAVPQPRALISTPVHLRTLLTAGVDLPPLELVVCATAPLAQDVAQEVEARFGTRLVEVYGSTETGQIATRRTAESAAWRLWPDVHLVARDALVFAEGDHLEQITPLCDVIDITSEGEFLLRGRTADMVDVAGKRSSFGYLNVQLNAIPGVIDGAFFLCEADAPSGTGVARVAAAVVAPTLSAAHLIEQLRQRIDPAFLPRPLLLVDRLPRNATGKLPHDALQSFARQHLRASGPGGADGVPAASGVRTEAHCELAIAADHASFAGHFPGFPILPGAVLLDEALRELARSRCIDLTHWEVASAKFLEPVRPGDPLTLQHAAMHDGTIRFTIRSAARTMASGVLSAIAASDTRGA